MSRWCALCWIAVAGASCAYEGAEFTIDRSAELLSAHNTISVFGVYRDGRMDPEYWRDLGPRLAGLFGPRTCELLVDERLHAEEPDLFTKIDEDTKQNGVSSELLGQVAARATGASIIAIQLSGHPPTHQRASSTASGRSSTGPSRGGRGGGRRGGPAPREDPVDDNAFDVFVSLFSVQTHQIVLSFTMQYTGTTVDDAIKKFATRLGVELPGSSCVGWKWNEPPATGVIEAPASK